MSDKKYPSYVRCVRVELGDGKERVGRETLCGRSVAMEWCYNDVSHWMLSVENGDRFLLCPECAERLKAALKIGVWNEPKEKE